MPDHQRTLSRVQGWLRGFFGPGGGREQQGSATGHKGTGAQHLPTISHAGSRAHGGEQHTTPIRRTGDNTVTPGVRTECHLPVHRGTPTAANPRAVSNWPDFDPAGRPRSATLVIRKLDGGAIGS
jgi:secreted PhoX family phosphatase